MLSTAISSVNQNVVLCRNDEKWRNCMLQKSSPFLTMFSTAVKYLVRQNASLCGNGLIGVKLCACGQLMPVWVTRVHIYQAFLRINVHILVF